MLCFIYKWLVSRSLDGGNSPVADKYLKQHMSRCPSCKAFAGHSESLERRLIQEAAAVTPGDAFSRKLAAALHPSMRGARESAASDKAFLAKPPVVAWRPISAAAVVLGLTVVLVLMSNGLWVNRPPAEGQHQALVVRLTEIVPDPQRLQNLAVRLELPLHQEMESLKSAFNAAKTFFQESLTFN